MHTWTYANNVCSIPELQISKNVSAIGFGSTSANIRLFHGYNGRTPAQIAEYKHTKNGVVVCNLIAVRFTNENGVSEGAMYDKVTKQLFRNQGTGSFIIGPDK